MSRELLYILNTRTDKRVDDRGKSCRDGDRLSDSPKRNEWGWRYFW